MSQDTTVLVCCHKKDYWYDGPGFLPIQVGKALSNIDLGIQGDNTGDNISSKNPNYCELTAHYWYWKMVIKRSILVYAIIEDISALNCHCLFLEVC